MLSLKPAVIRSLANGSLRDDTNVVSVMLVLSFWRKVKLALNESVVESFNWLVFLTAPFAFICTLHGCMFYYLLPLAPQLAFFLFFFSLPSGGIVMPFSFSRFFILSLLSFDTFLFFSAWLHI